VKAPAKARAKLAAFGASANAALPAFLEVLDRLDESLPEHERESVFRVVNLLSDLAKENVG
jgi:hypothetical protein